MNVQDILSNKIILAGLIIIGALLAAKLLCLIINQYLKKFTKKTKTDIDDLLLAALEIPFIIAALLVGSYFSLQQIDYLSKNQGVMNNIFFILGILWAVFVLHRVMRVILNRWLRTNSHFKNIPKLVLKVVNVFIYFIGLIIILKRLNVEITPLIATLGIGGIAIGFALQDTLSNFFAGLHIISDKPIRIGDFIELGGEVSGYVDDIGWRSTKIRTLPNTLVIVPNSKIASTTITNDSLPVPEMSVVIQCGVAYTSDLEKVEKVTVDVGRTIQKKINGAVKNFEPFIRYHTFGDSNINFSVILRVENFVDKYIVTHEFIKALQKRYSKENIEISWPVRKVYQADLPRR